MADEGQVIRGINWRQTFPFVNIFRAFRVAIHPSKLFLGLALLLTVYAGGRILDALWPIRQRAVPNEVEQFQGLMSHGQAVSNLKAWRDDQQKAIDAAYAEDLYDSEVDAPANKTDEKSIDAAHTQAEQDAKDRSKIGDVLDKIKSKADDTVKAADVQYDKDVKAANDAYNKDVNAAGALKTKNDAVATAAKTRDSTKEMVYEEAAEKYQQVQLYRGIGLFKAFFEYEINQVNGIVDAVGHNDWLVYGGVVDHVFNLLTVAPVWLISVHTVFAILFALLFLFGWSIFGGGIARIAAVHVAREEKISIRQAMNFSAGKFLSFASAPVIPLLIVLVIGLLVTAAALLINLPVLGPIVVGALFVLPLLAGFIMTLVLLGTAGGFNLMYPTIAVEGSDSFDAISRSFSYVYARPWRMLFYSAIGVAYGAATYMFVHMFIKLMLILTHSFMDIGVLVHASNTHDLLSTMWPGPNVGGRLSYSFDSLPLSFGQKVGAYLIECWVMLLVSFLGAFAISLYFSTNTIIYYLMRAEVDATEMDDVYLEQSDEDFGEAAPITTPAGASPAAAMVTVTESVVVTETPPPTNPA